MVSIGLSVFIILLLLIIFREYTNEKKYQAQRHQRHSAPTQKVEKETSTPKPSEKTQPSHTLPKAEYPKFTHQRLVDMGLSNAEAKEFVQELIVELETQILRIKEMLDIKNFHQMERLTHSIKGAATNIGTGGVSDLLVAYNTYLKKGTDIHIIKAYFEQLKHYTQELKIQYT
ncbi:MAG TPA: Hpt domain-containing protein [Epsilonproteobacteria bacterium]|nr:Hpt domain-containing protein [Campylobacterota bacterium]